MVVFVAVVWIGYGRVPIACSTRECKKKRERCIDMLTFFFLPGVVGDTRCSWGRVWRDGVVIVDDGDRHGGAVLDWNSYIGLRRLKYHSRM